MQLYWKQWKLWRDLLNINKPIHTSKMSIWSFQTSYLLRKINNPNWVLKFYEYIKEDKYHTHNLWIFFGFYVNGLKKYCLWLHTYFRGADIRVNYKHEGVTCWHIESIIPSMTSPLPSLYDVYAWRDVTNISWITYKWLLSE